MFLLRGAVIDDLFFPLREFPERHIRPHSHFPADICHQRPHETVPGCHRSLVNAQGIIRHQRIQIHGPHASRTAALRAGSLGIKCQFFCTGGMHLRPAFRTQDLLLRRYFQSRRHIMSVGTAMGCQTGIHQTQTVQKFRAGSKGTADPGNAGALMQCQCCRNIEDFLHLCFRRTGHTSSRVCGQGFQITSGALCIENSQRQRRFSRTGYPGDSHYFV